jgi:hypothetical protein
MLLTILYYRHFYYRKEVLRKVRENVKETQEPEWFGLAIFIDI